MRAPASPAGRRGQGRRIVVTCADGAVQVKVRNCTQWTRRNAFGVGRLVENECRPSCVSGEVHRRTVSFGLLRPVTTASGDRLFSRMVISYVEDNEHQYRTFTLVTEPLTRS